MIFSSTSTGKLKVVSYEQVQIQKNYYHYRVVLCSLYCHNKRVCMQAGTDILQWAVLCCYRCNKLVSITTDSSLSLFTACSSLGPLSSANWEACEIFQTHLCFPCVCDAERESEIGLLSKRQVVLFRFLSGHAEPHISSSNISEVFYGVILAQYSCTVPKGSWIRFSN